METIEENDGMIMKKLALTASKTFLNQSTQTNILSSPDFETLLKMLLSNLRPLKKKTEDNDDCMGKMNVRSKKATLLHKETLA